MAEAQFPTTFADERLQLPRHGVAPAHYMPLEQLGKQGFVVEVGLMRDDVPALTEIAKQLGTQEYCPNDLARRWTDEPTAEAQLAKDGGRGVFLLRAIANNAIIGFGWTGKAGADEQAITKYEHTFAVRLHEDARGQGLAVPFTKVIVAASMQVFRARRIGLETWASNTAAINTYAGDKGANAQLVKAVRATRPTLDTSKPFDEKSGKHMTEDTRLYMRFPWSI